MTNRLPEKTKNELMQLIELIEKCKNGNEVLSAHDAVDKFILSHNKLNKRKKTKPIYSDIKKTGEYLKTKIYLKMNQQL